MKLQEELSPDTFDVDSFFSQTGSSFEPNQDSISLDDLFNNQESTAPCPWKDDIQFCIDHLPSQTPTPMQLPPPASTPWLPLLSLRSNGEPSGPCVTREDRLHSTGRYELEGSGRYDSSKLVVECAAALSQGGHIASSTRSPPPLTPVACKQKGRKQSLDKLRTTRQKIGAQDLEKQFGKKRAEAAKSLDVSVSTLKRKSRMSGIACWPSNKSKNRDMSAKIVDPVSSMLPESEISSPPMQLGIEIATEKEAKPMTVKVEYGDDCVKFEIFSALKADLEEEISKRLKLMVGSFKIKYLDEEQDLISITCDADLQLCKKSIGMKTVKMSVLPSPT